ncbi:MAG: DUF3105 domain-containing protein [Actinomycetota bacterium]|nr:DUF3105 domain-containing protein [Actinomycetota bacterium]
MSRKLAEKRDRREAQKRRQEEERRALRRRNLMTTGIAVVVLAGAVALIIAERTRESAPVGVAASEASCESIQTYEPQKGDHIEDGASHPPYNSDPPTSGPHYVDPALPGFYPAPLRPEQLVHNLEHGQIVFWYRPDASEETITAIEALIDREPPAQEAALLAAPYDGVPASDSFVLTAWGASQSCDGVSQEVVDEFRARYQGLGPERIQGIPPFSPES